MKARLNELSAQIKLCEEFVALCERIRHVEKLQDGLLEGKKISVEAELAEIMTQMQLASENLQHLEATLHNSVRAIGVLEQVELKGFIETARIRLGSLRRSADNATAQIANIEAAMSSGVDELNDLYAKLENMIEVQGLDPNTVQPKLVELRREKDALREAMKAEVSSIRTAKPPQTKGLALREKEFYPALIADIAQAKNSIEIISPYVAPDRAREVMAELAQMVARGINVMVYTKPSDEQEADLQVEVQAIITDAHRMKLTVIQRSAIPYNAAIIDNVICWEGDINILGTNTIQGTMRRTTASSYVRQLRHYLFNE